MGNIQETKKQLLTNCGKFRALCGENPAPQDMGKMLILNGSIMKDLEEVLNNGVEADKKEALEAFALVAENFKKIYANLMKVMGIDAMDPAKKKALLEKSKYYNPELNKLAAKLAGDLEKFAKAAKKKEG